MSSHRPSIAQCDHYEGHDKRFSCCLWIPTQGLFTVPYPAVLLSSFDYLFLLIFQIIWEIYYFLHSVMIKPMSQSAKSRNNTFMFNLNGSPEAPISIVSTPRDSIAKYDMMLSFHLNSLLIRLRVSRQWLYIPLNCLERYLVHLSI